MQSKQQRIHFNILIELVLWGIIVSTLWMPQPTSSAEIDSAWYGCEECSPDTVILRFVSISGRPASSQELQAVTVIRQGRRVNVQLYMPLYPQDTIVTNSSSQAVILFSGGDRIIILDSDTQYVIKTKSSGKVIEGDVHYQSKKRNRWIKAIQDIFSQETNYVTAHTESTKYSVIVKSNYGYYDSWSVFIPVIEGPVTVTSNQGLWTPVVVGSYEQFSIQGQMAPVKTPMTPQQVDQIRSRTLPIIRYISGPPSPGSSPPGTRVSPSQVVVPDVTRIPLQDAIERLGRAGLRVGSITVIDSQTYPYQGAVICQSLWPGTIVWPGTSVNLKISGQ